MAQYNAHSSVSLDVETAINEKLLLEQNSMIELPTEKPKPTSFWRNEAKKLITSDDWWSVWVGFILYCTSFIASLISAYVYETILNPVLPGLWSLGNGTVYTEESAIGQFVLLLLATGCGILSFIAIQSGKKEEDRSSLAHYALGFWIVQFFALGIHIIASNRTLDQFGIKEEILAFFIGCIFGNIFAFLPDDMPLKKCASSSLGPAEYYIKIALVLLGIDFFTFGHLAVPAIVLSWPWLPLIIGLIYGFGKLIGFGNDSMLIMLAAGATVCGASAATSVKESIRGTQSDLTLTIAIITIFTVIQMVSVPYAARAIGIPLELGAAWIGASIDSTGAVAAAAAIFGGEKAIFIATTVKMVQNSSIGFISVIITLLWTFKDKNSSNTKKSCVGFLQLIWSNFPKFVLGFFIICGCISLCNLYMIPYFSKSLVNLVKSFSKWFFTLGFLGIGYSANFRMFSKDKMGGDPKHSLKRQVAFAVIVYIVGQSIDLGTKYLSTWLIRDWLIEPH